MTTPDASNRILEEIAAILAEGYLRLQRKTSQDQQPCDDQPHDQTNPDIIGLDRTATTPNTLDSTVNRQPTAKRSPNA